MLFQLQVIHRMVDGIIALRGYTVGIAIVDVPGLVQLVERISGGRKIGSDRPGVDIDQPFPMHGIGIENPCYGIIRVKFKDIAVKRRRDIAVILLIHSHIPKPVRYI